MALFFSGCSLKEQTAFENLYQKEEKNIELKMEQELKRKYGQKFEITGLKRKAGIMAMDKISIMKMAMATTTSTVPSIVCVRLIRSW